MDDEITMNYTISPDVQHAIADLVEICMKNKTDTITMSIDYPTAILEVEMNFKVISKKDNKDGTLDKNI